MGFVLGTGPGQLGPWAQGPGLCNYSANSGNFLDVLILLLLLLILLLCVFLFEKLGTRETATLALGSTTLALGFRGVRVGLVLGPGPGQLGPWAQPPGPRAQVATLALGSAILALGFRV